MLKQLVMAAVVVTSISGSVMAAPVAATEPSLGQSLIQDVNHKWVLKCTNVRYCAKVKWCYDNYDNKYNCGCYDWDWRKVCKKVKIYHKKYYYNNNSGSSY